MNAKWKINERNNMKNERHSDKQQSVGNCELINHIKHSLSCILYVKERKEYVKTATKAMQVCKQGKIILPC